MSGLWTTFFFLTTLPCIREIELRHKKQKTKTYNCDPRRRIRRSSSTKSAASIFSGLGEPSLYAVVSAGVGTRNDERLDGLPPPPTPGEFDAAAAAAADANIDGAKTSYAEALQMQQWNSLTM